MTDGSYSPPLRQFRVEPMDADSARRLTERIRIAATNYTEAKAKVLQLVDEAKAGFAHIALGYKSWTAYLSDVLSDEPLRLAREERRELVTRLRDEGMSTTAIAPIVGVSTETVRQDDIAATSKKLEVGEHPTVVRVTTGLDGKDRVSVVSGQTRANVPAGDNANEYESACHIDPSGGVNELKQLLSTWDKYLANYYRDPSRSQLDALADWLGKHQRKTERARR